MALGRWWPLAALVGLLPACAETTTAPNTIVVLDTVRIVDTVFVVDTVPRSQPRYQPVLVAEGLGGESGHLVALTADSAGILVAGQRGRIERLDGTLVVDLAAHLPNPPTGFGGLFNVVAHRGELFAFYSTNDSLAVVARVDTDGSVDPLIVSEPYRVQHYGGGLALEGDHLYAAFGDGQHFQGEGDTEGLYGRLVRMELSTGAVDTLARGLRSPWRIAVHGDSVWIGDTGAFLWEEINRVSTGDRSVHLGWPHAEGRHCHVDSCSQYQPPLFAYPTAAFGCSAVIGGVVWRDRYWFSDHCEAWFRSATDEDVFQEFDLPGQIISFATVADRMYVLGYQGGRIWEVVPAS